MFYNKYRNIIDGQSCILDLKTREPFDRPNYHFVGVPGCAFPEPAS